MEAQLGQVALLGVDLKMREVSVLDLASHGH